MRFTQIRSPRFVNRGDKGLGIELPKQAISIKHRLDPRLKCIIPGCSCRDRTPRVFTRTFVLSNIDLAVAVLNHSFLQE
jgi:hypothetical protein